MYVEANDARFWVVEKGEGSVVLFFHFGLGDYRVFEPQLDALADHFRCIAYDRRFYGRTEAPDEPYALGDEPCIIFMCGGRHGTRNVFVRDEIALRHGIGVEVETSDQMEAYRTLPKWQPGSPAL